MPSTSTTLSVRERPASRTGVGRGQAPQAAARARRVFRRPNVSAGVAQLVERQPSKLNVASSNLVSRSVFLGFGLPNPKPSFLGFGLPNPKPSFLGFGLPNPKPSFLGFGLPNPKPGHAPASSRTGGAVAPSPALGDLGASAAVAAVPEGVGFLSCFAHLAQLVEHVLGKDEVTSSILVVGSKRLRRAARLFGRATSPGQSVARRFAVTVVCSGAGVTTKPATH
jgi:hypothetical protein